MRFTAKKTVSIMVMLSLILLLLSLLSCSNTETETTPLSRESSTEECFKIEVSTPVEDAAQIWTVNLTVTQTYHQYPGAPTYEPVNFGSIEVSFPGISNVTNIKQYTTSMAKGIKLIPPGAELSTNYGLGSMINASYPVLQASEDPWYHDRIRQMSFKVLPEKKGTFTFYVKAQGMVTIENRLYPVYSPAIGTKDQQMEYVEVHTFTVD